jgi:mono/diheme cytochrome c family protein
MTQFPTIDRWPFTLLLATAALVGAASTTHSATPPDFARDVAPIFQQHCLRCHQPSRKQGELSLATADDLLANDYVIAGKPDESHLLDLVTSATDLPPKMPKEGAPLTAQQVSTLRAWIDSGANWPKEVVIKEKSKADKNWWSLRPLAQIQPPTIKPEHSKHGSSDWSQNPIDRFILTKLLEKGLQPSPPADKKTLLRRATYDLLGLPPTPEELAAFLADESPDAFDRVIDRLLQSPHYGERWGRHWLDVVRFGESRGYERNQIIDNLWPFRDYVVRSLNDDKPFDQFIREHLAGDIFGKDQPEIEVGAAFLTAGPYDDVGNKDPVAAKQIRADTIDEMIRATSEAFLGLTIGCARCHNHKFDPIATRDYYSLYATFAGVIHGERAVSTGEQRRARQAQIKPLEQQRQELTVARESLEKDLISRAAAQEAEAAKLWTRPRLSRYGTEESFAPCEAKFVRLIVAGTDTDDDKQSFRIDEFEIWTAGSQPRNVALAANGAQAKGASREAKDFQGAYGAALTIDGKLGERWVAGGNELLITLAEPAQIQRVFFSSDRLRALGENYPLTTFVGDYRIETSLDGRQWTEVSSSYDRIPASPRCKAARLRKLVTTKDDETRFADFDQQLAKVNSELARIPPLPSWWVGKRQDAPGPFQVFIGGDPQKPGDTVLAASISTLDDVVPAYQLDAKQDEASRRLALADYLIAPANPLTPRVLANRVWHYHFGCGLVDTPSDFGYMGGRPTHPELLDYLARTLQVGGWKLKSLHRLIMTSQAYLQTSTWRDATSQVDGDSLLWRFPPHRLSAEELRDSMLAVAGKLDTRMNGPGFRLYEYQQDNVATYVPLDEHGPDTYRRAIYHQNARAARVDLMSEFDCPDNAFGAPRRAATTTPLQALTLLNHKFTLDMAAALADRLTQETRENASTDATAAQIQRAYLLAFGRTPSEDEIAAATTLIKTHGLRAFCRALLNSNEFVYVR